VNGLKQRELQSGLSGDTDTRPGENYTRECAGSCAGTSADAGPGTTSRESADDSPESSRAPNGENDSCKNLTE
jgi:hypothetical protein